MKKSLLITAFAAFTITSCKKDHSCVCTYINSAYNETYTAKSKKKDAEAWCKSLETAKGEANGQVGTFDPKTCVIK